MNKHVERVQNLIRVVSSVPDERFDIRLWWNPSRQCGCAIGHAMQDQYFQTQGLGNTRGPDSVMEVAEFLDISPARVIDIFICRPRYGARLEVLTALRVLLMEKEAESVAASAEQTVEFLAADIKSDIESAIEADILCRYDSVTMIRVADEIENRLCP